MANEREVKERGGWARKAVCTVTGDPCRCVNGGGCRNSQPTLDKVAVQTVRDLRTARLYAQAAMYKIDDVLGDEHLLQRRYPQPEAREVRRKLATAVSMIDEICGELK